MRRAGVTHVVIATNIVYSAQFAQQADSQLYDLDYSTSDMYGMTADLTLRTHPAGFKAWAVTDTRRGEFNAGYPLPNAEKLCLDRHRSINGSSPKWGSDAAGTLIGVCGILDYFVAGAKAAGTSLTVPSFVTGMQSLGQMDLPDSGGASFGPNKTDGGDHLRILQTDRGCTCWKATSKFERVP
jgi:hypothetical protein